MSDDQVVSLDDYRQALEDERRERTPDWRRHPDEPDRQPGPAAQAAPPADPPPPRSRWRMDEHTRDLGRRRLAEIRAEWQRRHGAPT